MIATSRNRQNGSAQRISSMEVIKEQKRSYGMEYRSNEVFNDVVKQ
jgi:hypothetical protein